MNIFGITFHFVDDFEWQDTVYSLGNTSKKDGLFIIGGHFGGINARTEKDNTHNLCSITKRITSALMGIAFGKGFI